MYNTPYTRPSLLGKLLGSTKDFNFSSFLDGTQKTLGVINQAIPIVYQVKPMFQNAKTMFRIADEIRKPTNNFSSTNKNSNIDNEKIVNKPIFYI
jgi:hypothetical protein